MQIVDAYAHCGLSKYEPLERVQQVMAAAGVQRAVLAQHLGEFDNTYIARAVENDPEHLAGVCMVDHQSDDAVAKMQQWAATGHFKGVRLTTRMCIEAPGVLHGAVNLEMIIVLYAIDGMDGQVGWLLRFLDAHPGAKMVVTHLGLSDRGIRPSPDLFDLADHPGVHLQVSGMKMVSPYPHESLYGLIEQGVERFGPQRLLWGSNYPVVGDGNDYIADLELLLGGKLPIPPEAVAAVAGGNAGRLWF